MKTAFRVSLLLLMLSLLPSVCQSQKPGISSPLAAPSAQPQSLLTTFAIPIGVVTGALLGLVGVWWQARRNRQTELDKMKLQETLERERRDHEIQKLKLEAEIGVDRESKLAEAKYRQEAQWAKDAEDELALARTRTAEQNAEAYKIKLAAELEHLRILDMGKSIPLDQIYVQVRVRQEEPLRYVKEEEMRQLAEGEPAALMEDSQRRLAERSYVAVPPQEGLRQYRCISVLGDPGAGKTTMLRYVAHGMARGTLSQLPPLPIYVELRSFVDSGFGGLIDFVAADWEKRYGFPDAKPYIEQELKEGRAALLLDGLDEVLGGATREVVNETYKRVTNEINRLSTLFDRAHMAVTCRRAGWQGGLTAFQNLEVLDFGPDQIDQFIGCWFADDTARAEGLRKALKENLRMQTLAANPLLLSLIAIVFERDLELPERRGKLYERCVDVMLREWDSHREIKRFSQFTADRKRDLLEQVAWRFHLQGKRYFPESELLSEIADFLVSIGIGPEANKEILDEIAAQYGLLKVQAHGWHGFLHLTLQEYFTALAAIARGQAALDEVAARRENPWWEEVILLMADRMSDATPLLLALLGRANPDNAADIADIVSAGEPLCQDDDHFHSSLLLAGRCLGGCSPRITMAGLRDRLIAEIEALLLEGRYHFDRERAADVLIQIDQPVLTDKLFEIVTSASNENQGQVVSVVNAIGRYADRETALRLLPILDEGSDRSATQGPLLRAIAAQKLTEATPTLCALLTKHANENEEMRLTNVVAALGELGDRAACASLWMLMSEYERALTPGYAVNA